jgi:hypothetical protein
MVLATVKRAGKTTEGTAPLPPFRPSAYRDDDRLPVQDLSRFGGAAAGGVEIPVSVYPGRDLFSRAKKIFSSNP